MESTGFRSRRAAKKTTTLRCVADLIGKINFLAGTVRNRNKGISVLDIQEKGLRGSIQTTLTYFPKGWRVPASVRPENIQIHTSKPDREFNTWQTRLERKSFLGGTFRYGGVLGGDTLNALEKILARASGRKQVTIGEIVDAVVDRLMITERQGARVVDNLQELGMPQIRMPKEKVIVVFDHEVPPSKIVSANAQRRVRECFAGQTILYDINVGICHQVLSEKGHVEPGLLVVGTDSHTVTNGAFGTFATGIGITEATGVLLTGTIWLKIPPVMAVQMEGRLPPRVAPKDAMLHLVGRLHADGAQYKGLEFRGPGAYAMSLAGRMVMANMSVEVGAKAGFFAADEVTLSYLGPRVKGPLEPVLSAPDTEFEAVVDLDLSGLVPQVACPHAVDNVVPVTEVAGIEIHDAFLGSCTNGRLEDLQAAADILRGRRIHPRVRMIVVPASTETYLAALRSGVLETLVEAGAVVTNPNCASCASLHLDLLGDGEVSISSTNRNFRGRRGSREAEVYLASPATVAASALAGCIGDPREF